jgi:hypothetical protein
LLTADGDGSGTQLDLIFVSRLEGYIFSDFASFLPPFNTNPHFLCVAVYLILALKCWLFLKKIIVSLSSKYRI